MLDVLVGLVELVLAVCLGFLSVWFSFRMFGKLTNKFGSSEALKNNNVAVGILFGSTIISTAFVVKQAAYPIISSLQTFAHKGIALLTLIRLLGIALICIALVMVIALVAIWIAFRLFLRLTKDIDEMSEIRRNNIAVALVLGSMIIVIGLFLSQGIQSILSTLIPMPVFGNIQVM